MRNEWPCSWINKGVKINNHGLSCSCSDVPFHGSISNVFPLDWIRAHLGHFFSTKHCLWKQALHTVKRNGNIYTADHFFYCFYNYNGCVPVFIFCFQHCETPLKIKHVCLSCPSAGQVTISTAPSVARLTAQAQSTPICTIAPMRELKMSFTVMVSLAPTQGTSQWLSKFQHHEWIWPVEQNAANDLT